MWYTFIAIQIFLGGGLYCFDKDNESTYYFMGALHGGNEDATKDRYMYFSNNAYKPYAKL